MAELPTGWVKVGALSPRQRIALSAWALSPFLTSIFLVPQAVHVFFESASWVVTVTVGILSVILTVAVAILVHASRNPVPDVNFDTKQFRVGSRTVSFDDIDTAVLQRDGSARSYSVALRFGAANGPQGSVYLRHRTHLLIDPETREKLVAVLRESNIRMPESPHDPSGRFARYNFPHNIDRDDAITVVLDPPGPAEPLPISGG